MATNQIVLRSAQRISVPAIAEIAFISLDRVREVNHNFNAHEFDSLAAKFRRSTSSRWHDADTYVVQAFGDEVEEEHEFRKPGVDIGAFDVGGIADIIGSNDHSLH